VWIWKFGMTIHVVEVGTLAKALFEGHVTVRLAER